MGDYDNLPGPDPSSLDSVNHLPQGVMPMTLRVTYTSNSLTDYVHLKRSNGRLTLELGDPLFGVVRKASNVYKLKKELGEVLAAIGMEGLVSHFTSAIAEYVNGLLSVPAFSETIGLGVAAYLLKKMHEAEMLMLGYIHQASIDELPSWKGLVDNARTNSDLQVS